MRGMRRRGILLAALLLLVAILVGRLVPLPERVAGDATAPTVEAGPAVVLRVVDGDTVRVAIDGREETVRVVGIDTPEVEKGDSPAACFGGDAAEATRAWVQDRTVRLEPAREQRDRYGRLLASIEPVDGPIGGRDLARTLALGGYARVLTIPPNGDDAATLEEYVGRARAEGRGLWGACGFARAFPGKRDPAEG
jgi:micrococcal nuclease